VAAARVGGWWAAGGESPRSLLDPGGEPLDLAARASIWSSSILRHKGVVLVEAAGQRLPPARRA
jgi:hypothetical protein